MLSRFLHLPTRSCFLFGPRGTGKSTWLRAELADALYLDLLDPALYRSLRARPERLRELIAGAPGSRDVVVDEVQRIPELLTVVHSVLESSDARRFALTGSSATKLRRGGVDLRGGRALDRTMHPFMAAELPASHRRHCLSPGGRVSARSCSEPPTAVAEGTRVSTRMPVSIGDVSAGKREER